MIVVAGIPSERPVELVLAAARALGVPVAVFNQRQALATWIYVDIDASGEPVGHLDLDGDLINLAEVSGVYLRTMDHRLLPEVQHLAWQDARLLRVERLHDRFHAWTEVTPALVFNRGSAMASNGSKPYQAQLIRAAGFRVPRTLVTNDPVAVREFAAELDGEVIYKSASGARSIVRRLEADDLDRLDAIRWCPTQFQERVLGFDVRVHVVGREVFASKAVADAIDYRYAHHDGGPPAELQPYDLPPGWADACIHLAHSLGLPLAGIDLKRTPDGGMVCFEVNPSPGFSYYEETTGQPISRAIVRALAG